MADTAPSGAAGWGSGEREVTGVDDDVREAAAALARLVAAIEAGELTASEGLVAQLRGAVLALEQLPPRTSVRDTDV